jgi:hypothetical protein
MAFCNACGAKLEAGTKFCSKCGATSPGVAAAAPVASAVPAVATAAPAPPPPSSGALKIILIVVGAIVVLGMIGLASLGFVAYRVAHHSHVRQEGDHVSVETPFGSVETTKDPEQVASNLGVDIYPGAEILKEGASSASFGGIHTVAASFESSDSAEKVSDFYKAKFPSANVISSDRDRCTIVSNEAGNLVTVNIEARGGVTKIHISKVTHGAGTGSSSTN